MFRLDILNHTAMLYFKGENPSMADWLFTNICNGYSTLMDVIKVELEILSENGSDSYDDEISLLFYSSDRNKKYHGPRLTGKTGKMTVEQAVLPANIDWEIVLHIYHDGGHECQGASYRIPLRFSPINGINLHTEFIPLIERYFLELTQELEQEAIRLNKEFKENQAKKRKEIRNQELKLLETLSKKYKKV